jgi:metabolite-proton symporter
MTTSDTDRSLRNIALASYVGSAIEFYDFVIYGTAAALVFPAVFFPHLPQVVATIASLGTFAAAFLSRPVGAAVFGHYGDRIGRKQTLVLTLLIMGGATVGVGLIPSTATIGVAAPLLLILLRLAQGFAVGGEWAGSVLLGAESAPPGRRGFYGMFTQLGLGTAVVLANLVFLAVHVTIGDKSAAFLTWGWRLPFLLSAVLVSTALYIRMHIEESPEFTGTSEQSHDGLPLADLLREGWREVLLAAVTVSGVLMLVYQLGTFVTHYASVHMHYSKDVILLAGVLGGLVTVGCVAASATLSDTYGQRRCILVGVLLAVPWSLLLMPLVDTRRPLVFTAAVVVTYAIIGIGLGPLASYIPGLFATRYRYTGTALSYNVGGILGGGIPPVVSPALVTSYGSWAVGLMMCALAVASLLSTVALGGTPDNRLNAVAKP